MSDAGHDVTLFTISETSLSVLNRLFDSAVDVPVGRPTVSSTGSCERQSPTACERPDREPTERLCPIRSYRNRA
jgi:hypothetical protein